MWSVSLYWHRTKESTLVEPLQIGPPKLVWTFVLLASGRGSRSPSLMLGSRIPRMLSLLSRSGVKAQLLRHEGEKKRQYCQRINDIDRGSFTPLVFATNGMCGNEAHIFLKSLADMIHTKNPELKYPVIINRLRCKLSFCLLRWCITCMRGSRSTYHRRQEMPFAVECAQF